MPKPKQSAKLRPVAKVVRISPNKVAIYVRWSTDEQGEGTTLQTQLERCKSFLHSQGWNVNDSLIYIDDGYSGGNLDRPAITKLRQNVKDDLVDCVVMFKLDRLSRSVVDTVNLVLEEWDEICYIKSVTEPFDTTEQIGRQILTMLAGFAEWERYNIKLRTFEGKIETVEKGTSPGFKPPYGYAVGDTTGTFKIIKDEAEIVRRIYREYRAGKGRAKICHDLNAEGILFRNNKQWNDSTISHILKNPLYIGRLLYGRLQRNSKYLKREGELFWNRRDSENVMVKELEEEIITPIITVEEFNLVRKIRESRDVFKDRRTSGRAFTSPHLLSGLVRCKCGHGFTARRKQGNDNYAYYMCRGNKTKGNNFCDCGYIRQDELDSEVMSRVKQRFLNERDNLLSILVGQQEERVSELNIALQSITTRKNELAVEYENLKQRIRGGNIDPNLISEINNDITKERENLDEKEVNIISELDQISAHAINTDDIMQFSLSLNKWDELPLEEQKVLLYKWIDSVEMYKPKKGKAGKPYIKIRYNSNIDLDQSYSNTAV